MKITKTKLAAASFGAALTSMYSAPELSAQVVDLTFTPSIVPYDLIVPITAPTVVFGIPTSNGVSDITFVFFNDSIGRTFIGPLGATSFATVDPGDVFSGFVPADGGGQTFTSTFFPPAFVSLANGLTGIETFGFVLSGDAGFFRVDLQSRGPITFLDGQLAIGSSSIAIPEVPTVPEPSSVGLTALALGAAGLRRRRKTAKAA